MLKLPLSAWRLSLPTYLESMKSSWVSRIQSITNPGSWVISKSTSVVFAMNLGAGECASVNDGHTH